MFFSGFARQLIVKSVQRIEYSLINDPGRFNSLQICPELYILGPEPRKYAHEDLLILCKLILRPFRIVKDPFGQGIENARIVPSCPDRPFYDPLIFINVRL